LQKCPHYFNIQKEKIVAIEISAEFIKIKFAKYIPFYCPSEFFDPKLPLNKENYENQKEKVKSIILELAEYKL
jgi:hypothetical protein